MGDGCQVGNLHSTGEGVSFVLVLVIQRKITDRREVNTNSFLEEL
jgi:hypothetical protein